MSRSPQEIGGNLNRFPQRFSFDAIGGILNAANTTFHFKENFKLKRIIFLCDQESYDYPVFVKRKMRGTENIVSEEVILQMLTTRNFTIEWDNHIPLHVCDELWLECDYDDGSVKSVIIELSKWSN